MNAINDEDIESFERIKSCRNDLAHRVLSMLGSEVAVPDFARSFHKMAALLRKIEVWWIKEFEIPTNPDFDGQEISDDGIVLGRSIGLQLLCDIALGDESRSRFYFEEFRKQTKKA